MELEGGTGGSSFSFSYKYITNDILNYYIKLCKNKR